MRHVQLRSTSDRGSGGDDERGSIIVVLAVILVVVTLSSLLAVRVIGNDQIIMGRQAAYTGLSAADAGLSDALFRLDQGGADTPSDGVMCLNATDPSDSDCISQTNLPAQLSGVSYVARTVPAGTSPANATEWVVQAIGTAQDGMRGAVQETLTRTPQYPFALFGKKSLSFTGNTTGNFGTFNPGPYSSSRFEMCPSTATNPPCLSIGSDGSLTCSGPSPASVQGIYFNTGSGGGSQSCGTSQSQNTNYNVPEPYPPSGNYTCPMGGTMGSTYDSAGTTDHEYISGGTYVCTSPISIAGDLYVTPGTGPVLLYVMLPQSQNTASTAFLQVATDSQINTFISYADMQSGGPQPSDTLPDPTQFQLFSNSVGDLTVNGSHGFVYGGVIDAPEASLTANGCQSYIFGAAIINTYTCHGGPNLGLFYDTQLSSFWGAWQVSSFQQINPASVCIPDPNTGVSC
ncbi:MAG TPA: hypothetical protein VKU88_07365 [Acidimicrobiales bacterium]|nr:hypothetical protein [Acidimicrobiales bacterium]